MTEEKRIDIMLLEKAQQQDNLRNFDKSLHQTAFAFITAMAVGVPAILAIENKFLGSPLQASIIIVLGFQIIFFLGFYAVMLVRSRNVCCAHIKFISYKINECIEECGKEKILFELSSEISDFANSDGKRWFFSCVLALIPVVLVVLLAAGYCLLASWMSLWIRILVLLEIVGMVFFVITCIKSSQKSFYDKIEYDYKNQKKSTE